MIGRALALAALVGSAGIGVVPVTHAKPIAVSHELLQQASIITPEGVTVDPNNNPGFPEYTDDAFIYARQALDALGIGRDKVKLCYNDFNTTISKKRTFIYTWVQGAIGRGVPIDCVGNQFHNNINFPIGEFSRLQDVLNIQPVVPIGLSEDWLLISRWITPVV